MVCAFALVLTHLVKAVSTFLNTFNSSLIGSDLSKYGGSSIIFGNTIVDTILIVRSAFRVAVTRALLP